MLKNLFIILLVGFCALLLNSCKDDSTPITPGGPGPTTNHPPDTARNPQPPDQANVSPGNITLSWTCTDPDQGDTLRYNVYFDNVSPPTQLVSQNQLTTSYVVNVQSGTRYWRIVSRDNHGDSTQGFIWRFRAQ